MLFRSLLTAIATDGNGQLFPVAFAIVEREKNETWEWFFKCLRDVVGNHSGLTIISDRHAGIIHSMRGNRWKEPYGYHRFCMRHFQANFNSHVKDKTVVQMLVPLIKARNKLSVTAIVMNMFYKLNSYLVRYREMAENRVIAWSDDVMKKMEDRNNKAARHTVRVYNFNEGVYEVSTGSYRTVGGMQRGERHDELISTRVIASVRNLCYIIIHVHTS